MNTRFRNTLGYLCASVWTLVCAAPTDAAAAGSVALLSQERLVEATASSPSGTDAKNRSSVDTGPFSEAVSAFSSFTGCLSSRPDAEATRTPEPDGGVTPNPCITITSSATAGQDSIIAAHDGVLDVRARGSMSRSFSSASARSRLTTTFMVEGTVPYILQGDRLFGQITLTGPGGTVFDVPGAQGNVSEAGYLTEGSYTLVAEIASLFGNFNVRFTAGSIAAADGPRCTVRMTRPSYTMGEIVEASLLRVQNPLPDPVFVELKIWLRLPDGRLIPARNEGADGSMVVYGGTTQDFGPLSVMGVGPDIAQGLWEFGCRLLDPVSGQQLYENNDLFVIR